MEISNFATYFLALSSAEVSTEIKEEPDKVEPEINIKEDRDINIDDIRVNDTIIESDKN